LGYKIITAARQRKVGECSVIIPRLIDYGCQAGIGSGGDALVKSIVADQAGLGSRIQLRVHARLDLGLRPCNIPNTDLIGTAAKVFGVVRLISQCQRIGIGGDRPVSAWDAARFTDDVLHTGIFGSVHPGFEGDG